MIQKSLRRLNIMGGVAPRDGMPDSYHKRKESSALQCPACKRRRVSVIDSRPDASFRVLRRRRCCADCGQRWTTLEITEDDLRASAVDGRELAKSVGALIVQACEERISPWDDSASAVDAPPPPA